MEAELLRQLARDEGLRLKPYRDTRGKLTIGVGRNLDDQGISEAEAYHLLRNDLAEVLEELNDWLPWAGQLLDPARYGVLANMLFNMGKPRLAGFKNMLASLRKGDYNEAADHLRDSNYWRSDTHRRAERLARQLETGVWQ